MMGGRHGQKPTNRTYLTNNTEFASRPIGATPRRRFMGAEPLEPRMLLSGTGIEDGSGVSLGDPVGSIVADQWVPFVPSAEQTEMQAQTVGDLTSVKVAIHVNSPGFQVSDWGMVKQEGSTFSVDAKVEQWDGPVIDVIQPVTFSHRYELGKLDPNAKYHFTFQSWGKEVETLYFSVPTQLPVVSIAAKPLEIREPIPNSDMAIIPSQVTVTRAGPITDKLDVILKLGGTATPLQDYAIDADPMEVAPNLVHVAIPAGSTSTTFFVTPLEDTLSEGNETVSLTFVPTSTYRIGLPESARITIIDAQPQWIPYVPTPEQTFIDVQTVNGAAKATVKLALWNVAFRVTDWGQVAQDGDKLVVNAKVEEYVGIPLGIPQPVDPPPIVHDYALGELKPGSYAFVFNAWDKLVEAQPFTIPAEVPVVTVKATDPIATEPNPLLGVSSAMLDTGRFTFTRTGPVDRSLMVNLKYGGTAEGADYQFHAQYPIFTFAPLPPGEAIVYFPEGESTSYIDVFANGDSVVEGDETVIFKIVDGNSYDVGTPDAATVTIKDIPEHQWLPYVPTPEQTTLAVDTVHGITLAGVKLQFGSPGYKVVDWGQVQQVGNEFVVDTKVQQYDGPVILVVPPPVSHTYELGALATGEYTFTFMAWGKTVESLPFKVAASAPAISIVAAEPVATEPIRGGPQPHLGLFKVVRAGPADKDLTVHLTATGTATHGPDYLFGAFDMGPFTDSIDVVIPAGYSWVPVPVLAKADAEVEGVETVILTVTTGDGYDVGANPSATVRIIDTKSPILRIRDRINGTLKDQPVALPDGSGKLDVADNELIVHLPEGESLADTLAYVVSLVRSGRNGGSWTGPGITSSTVANDALAGLAVAPDELAGQIRVKQTYNGDTNLDGIVNADDYFAIDSGFMTQAKGYSNGDFNYDDVINADDYFLIDSAYIGQQAANSESQLAQAMPSLPATVAKDPAAGISAELFSTEPVL